MRSSTLDAVALAVVSADDARLDYLVNVEGLNQLKASQMLWAPELVTPVPGLDAPVEVRQTWVKATVRRIVRERLGDVLTWLGRTP